MLLYCAILIISRAQMISDTLDACPSTLLVVSGYSQGCQVTHKAAASLPSSVMAKVSSVVLFGDPDFGSAVQGANQTNTMSICHEGDDICAGGDLILAAHLTYSANAGQAAAFVSTRSKLN